MAVAFDGFSIREYTAKMRNVDVSKCWPFSNELIMEDMLPPITVNKFRWWFQELHHLRSKNLSNEETLDKSSRVSTNDQSKLVEDKDEKLELVSPVCRVFTDTTLNAVNAHIDECLAQVSKEERRKKVPKKRSIAEIFAVAPQIDAIEAEGSDGKEGCDVSEKEDNDNLVVDDFKVLTVNNSSTPAFTAARSKKKINRWRNKKRMVLEENSIGVDDKLKEKKKFHKEIMISKKKIIKKKKNHGFLVKKENSRKVKMQSSVKYAKKMGQKFAKGILNSILLPEKKQNLMCLSTEKQQNSAESAKIVSEKQKSVFPLRSILKNHTVCKQNSAIHSVQCGSQANQYDTQQSERHVRFSDKDDILGPRGKDFSSSNQNIGHLISNAFPVTSQNIQSVDNEVAAGEVNVADVVSVIRDRKTESYSRGKKQLADIPSHLGIPSSLSLHLTNEGRMKHLPKETVTFTQCAAFNNNLLILDRGYRTASHSPAFAEPISAPEGPCVDTQVGSDVSRNFSSRRNLINHAPDPVYRVSEFSPMANTRAFLEPSSCFNIENANQRPQYQSNSALGKTNDHALEYQPFVCPPPMEFISSLCPPMEWVQKPVAVRNKCMDEDFFGLPLNSQGELIQSNPKGKGSLNQLREGLSSTFPPHNPIHPRTTGDFLRVNNKHFLERAYPNDHLDLYSMHNCIKENPDSHLPARLGVTYIENDDRGSVHQLDSGLGREHSSQPLDPDWNLMSMPFAGRRQYDWVHNQNVNARIHQKDSGKLLPNTSQPSQPTMRLMGKDVAIGISCKEKQQFEDGKLWTDKEIITEHGPSSKRLDGSSGNGNFQHNWTPQITSEMFKQTVPQSLDIHRKQVSQNKLLMASPDSSFPRPHLNWQSGTLFQNVSSSANRNPSLSFLPFAHSSDYPTMLHRAPNFQEFISGAESLQLGSKLPVPHTPHNACEHTQWGSADPTYEHNTPHIVKSRFDFPFLNPDSRVNVQSPWFHSSNKSLPSWMSHATQLGKAPLVASQPFSSVLSKHHAHFSSGTSILNDPSIYHPPEFSFSCVQTTPSQATMVLPSLVHGAKPSSAISAGYRNRMKVKERLKSKALGIKDLYPRKKVKKRSEAKAVGLKHTTKIRELEIREKLSVMRGTNGEMKHGLRANDLDSSQSKACSLLDGVEISGPIKLGAGAKHILKPNENIDQDNFRPIHCTIPYAELSNDIRVPESQTKSTQIYQF